MKKTICLLIAILLVLGLAACGTGSVLGSEIIEETGFLKITAVNASDSEVNGHVSLGEGDCLLVSPMLDKGYFRLRVYPEGKRDEALLDLRLDGRVLSTYPLDPGDYELVVSGGNRATGSMTVGPYSTEKFQAENDALAEALEEAMTTPGPDEDGQNPVMNFVGPYAADRANMLVEPLGDNGAVVQVSWANSAAEQVVWTMSGPLDADTLTMEYADCVKTTRVYQSDGSVASETVEYENGTGRILFNGTDSTIAWEDDQENAGDGLVFVFSFSAGDQKK